MVKHITTAFYFRLLGGGVICEICSSIFYYIFLYNPKMKFIYILIVLFFTISCSKGDSTTVVQNAGTNNTNPATPIQTITDKINQFGDPSKGLNIYLNVLDKNNRACVNCHLSTDGFDIMFFGKTDPLLQDSIIIERAVFNPTTNTGHISLQDAYHIAAYFKQIAKNNNIVPNGNLPIIPIPKGQSPNQVWDGSTSLTENQINGWNFRENINLSFSFPKWFSGDQFNNKADENLDFIPEIDLLTAKEGVIRVAYNKYLKNPTKTELKNVLMSVQNTLSDGERNPGEHGYNDFNTAFDYARWKAVLYFQHIKKKNSDLIFGEEIDADISEFALADAIWDVGNVARRSQDNGSNLGNGKEIDNRLLNEVQWLYLGWLTNFGKRNSFESQYIGSALKDYGEQDLASLVILRSLVNRSDHSQLLFDDVYTMSYITSDNKLYESLNFGLNYLINGVKSGNPRFKLLRPDQIRNTLDNLKDNKASNLIDNLNNKYNLSVTQKDVLNKRIQELYMLVSNF